MIDKKKEKTERTLGLVYFVFTLMIILITTTGGCPHKVKIPKIEISLWAGDSEREAISRSQESKSISCKDPRIDEFVCLSYDDLKNIYSTFLKCETWNDSDVSEENTKKFLDQNEQINKFLFLDQLNYKK